MPIESLDDQDVSATEAVDRYRRGLHPQVCGESQADCFVHHVVSEAGD
jgi:hypothetical protein